MDLFNLGSVGSVVMFLYGVYFFAINFNVVYYVYGVLIPLLTLGFCYRPEAESVGI